MTVTERIKFQQKHFIGLLDFYLWHELCYSNLLLAIQVPEIQGMYVLFMQMKMSLTKKGFLYINHIIYNI